MQDVDRLASYFDVSRKAMHRRLQAVGLVERSWSRHTVAA
jgi:hypothetical protein